MVKLKESKVEREYEELRKKTEEKVRKATKTIEQQNTKERNGYEINNNKN